MTIAAARCSAPLILMISLTACSTPEIPPTVEAVGMPNAELALQRSLAQVDTDVGRLGTLQPPISDAQTGSVLPAELQKQMFLQWKGPLDGAVQKIGGTIGYQVTIQTPEKSVGVLVAVDSYGHAVDLLRTLGEQAGTRATVNVDPLHHQIMVVHHV